MPKTFFYQAVSNSQLLPFPTLFYGQSSTAVWLGQRQFWYVQSASSDLLPAFALTYGKNQEHPSFLIGKKRFDGLLQDVFLPASIVPFVPPIPPTVTCTGTQEWGICILTNLAAGTGYSVGQFQCYDRKSFNQVWFAQGTGAFNLDYQYTPDQGANWYIGKQVSSSTTTVDGGAAGYTQEARFVVQPGYQYRIQVYNTSAGAINIAFEHRYVGKH
jgi:hypothetical protein